jgi:hypothetical protein
LTIGLGSPLLVDASGAQVPHRFVPPLTGLSFLSASGNPPYFAALGREPASHDFVFYIFGHWSEFPARQAVEVAPARQALRQFVTGAGLPDVLEWEET